MGKIKPQMNKLSQGEADTISNFVKWGLDVIVKLEYKIYYNYSIRI